MSAPDINLLRNTVTYDPETGVFCRVKRCGKRPAGSPIGGINQNGYAYVALSGKPYSAHRLAWFMSYGEWPDGDIDHVNRNRSDNRLCNLRVVSRSENKLNQNRQRNNKHGYPGVTLDRGRWAAKITVKYEVIHLGTYDTYLEAKAARRGAEKVLGVPEQT
jgi:hypothetical protein